MCKAEPGLPEIGKSDISSLAPFAGCGGQMKVVAFIEPPQGDVIERILRHCGTWQPRPPRGEPSVHDAAGDEGSYDESGELTYVDEDIFWETF